MIPVLSRNTVKHIAGFLHFDLRPEERLRFDVWASDSSGHELAVIYFRANRDGDMIRNTHRTASTRVGLGPYLGSREVVEAVSSAARCIFDIVRPAPPPPFRIGTKPHRKRLVPCKR